ncbi:hypothetical protein GMORB2_6882 [Geosmithia morbida]|uniref:Uncharacterized protein n=1 Tax=Geosmithia morbida TaxID=1094350 RepID=A0A9P4YVP6_9HYPO|nr:uncharacterized protein GMORB2_6882 [Geosmithia morbida]KAF4122576.1 hypothetical protein GMORB2_6882 [Geosmithia morbida]
MNPLISASKQQRIDVWRTEVAALTLAVPATSGSSTASTTTSSSGASSDGGLGLGFGALLPAGAAGVVSGTAYPFPPLGLDDVGQQHGSGDGHRRSLWRRLARRVIRRGGGSGSGSGAGAAVSDLNHGSFNPGRRGTAAGVFAFAHRHDGGYVDYGPAAADDDATHHTDMYRSLRPTPESDIAPAAAPAAGRQEQDHPDHDLDHALASRDDDDPDSRRLRNRHDRLQRAARLLNHPTLFYFFSSTTSDSPAFGGAL